jgi:hypothetical protein
MKSLIAFPLLIAVATAAPAAVSVEAANGDWTKLPQLEQKGYTHLDEKMQAKLFEVADSKKCPSFLTNQGRLEFRYGFAVQYDQTGALTKLVIPQLNCAEAEGVTAGILLQMIQSGDYAPTGKSLNGWYQGTLGFSFAGDKARDPGVAVAQAQPGAVKKKEDTEQVCERVESIGSRLQAGRTCMTRSEWAEQKRRSREDIEKMQVQRDLSHQ